jgi:hypothetical protein
MLYARTFRKIETLIRRASMNHRFSRESGQSTAPISKGAERTSTVQQRNIGMAGGIAALAFLLSGPHAHGTALGYGELEATFNVHGGASQCASTPLPDHCNPSGDAANVAAWGSYINAVDGPNAEFTDPNDWHLAGQAGTSSTTNGAITWTFGNQFGGTWTYNGGVNNNDPVDLFINIKYSQFSTVFEFDHVHVNDTGFFSIDHTALGVPFCTAQDFNASGLATDCIGVQGNSRMGNAISHIVAYWPPDTSTLTTVADLAAPVPEPATWTLLVGALLGFGALRRRATTQSRHTPKQG